MPRFIKRFATAFASASVLALAAAGPAHAQEIRIGALYPLSGGLALLGEESFRGTEIAIAERNAAGGINGQKITLVKADAVDANQAVGEARRLTSVENVVAVFGSYASGVSSAATQVTELAGVPYFELGAVADTITGRGFKYVFRSNSTAKTFASRSVESIVQVVAPSLKADPKSLKIAIVYEDGPY
ncbi:ABC transporter substrate-binding protein, partial [Ramlibacter sp. WS9]|uniref:ABC transporter substrate-binding protein n=1 Tax=Ramlibacter sp. WS9 TaxID=1882741 RepID=UPI001E483CB4